MTQHNIDRIYFYGITQQDMAISKAEQRKKERIAKSKARRNRGIKKHDVDKSDLRPRNFQELMYKWLPATLEFNYRGEDFDVYDYYAAGTSGGGQNPLAIGSTNGALEIIGYTKFPSTPYAVRCVCGRVMKLNIKDFNEHPHCGCFFRAVRTAYLIRTRIEAVRSWLNNVGDWLLDLEVIEDYMVDFIDKSRGLDQRKTPYVRKSPAEPFINLLHGKTDPMPQEFLDFFLLISTTKSYKKLLTELVDKNSEYPLWEAIPLSDMSEYERVSNSLPEFDAATFINLIHHLNETEASKFTEGS
jgi:hypothetical protein